MKRIHIKLIGVITIAVISTVATCQNIAANDSPDRLPEDAQSESKNDSSELAKLQLVDISGTVHLPFEKETTKAIALIFVSTDCPIANSFQPVLQDLHQRFSAQGVACFMVYSSPKLQLDQVEKHRADYQIKMPSIIDANQKIGRLAKAKVTPEAIVIDRAGKIRYRGLINNLYAGYGKKRQSATKHYLRDAFDSLIKGSPVVTQKTKPVGCFIHYQSTKDSTKR